MRPVLLTTMLLALVLPGCEGDQPVNNPRLPALYAYKVPEGWRATVWVNGQPASVASGDEQTAKQVVTTFVVDGKNEVRVVAERVAPTTRPDGARPTTAPATQPEPFAFLFERVTGPSIDGLATLADLSADPGDTRVEKSFKFSATVPVRWTWQDSEDIGQLSDADRAAVRDWLSRLAEGLRSKNAQAVADMINACPHIWPDLEPLMPGQQYPTPQVDRVRGLTALYAYEDYTVTAAEGDALRFLAGTKVVRVHAADHSPLFRAGHATVPDGQPDQALSTRTLLFIRRGGRLQPLH